MPEVKHVCVVDCNEWIARHQFQDSRITTEDVSAVLVAATVLAVDNLYVDPILTTDSVLTVPQASAMVRSVSGFIADQLCDALVALPGSDACDASITTDSLIDNGLVILTLSLTKVSDDETLFA